jgi:hypothetical protein
MVDPNGSIVSKPEGEAERTGEVSELLSTLDSDSTILLSGTLPVLDSAPKSGQGPLFSVVLVLCTGHSEISKRISLFFAKTKLKFDITATKEVAKITVSTIKPTVFFKVPFKYRIDVYRRCVEYENKKVTLL